MKRTIQSNMGLKSLTAGIGAMLLALASIHPASAQVGTNTGTGPNVNVLTTNGTGAAQSITTGTYNSAYGLDALRFDTTGGKNTAVGALALRTNIAGSNNTALGYAALNRNKANNNTAVGFSTLLNNNNGANNVALGTAALFANTSGGLNTAVGSSSLRFNTTGASNVAIGFQAAYKNTTGVENVAIGDGALLNATTGGRNIGVGTDAGANLTVGSANIYIGHPGVGPESGIIRIGESSVHTDTWLPGNLHIDRIQDPIRNGSETGTTEAPDVLGLVQRRINSYVPAAGTIVARTDELTLERDGTSGGFNVVTSVETSDQSVITVTGVRNDGTFFGNVVNLPGATAAATSTPIIADADNVAHFVCTFGITFGTARHLTKATCTRDGLDYYWVGDVLSGFNQ